MSIYNAFIASNFNYCNTVWHFCSDRSLYKLEKLHKQALRVVLNDYSSSYRDLLHKVSKPTLYVSRLKAIATEAYKCKSNENPDYINVMLNPLIKPYNLRVSPRAEQPKVNTTSCGLHSFKYQIAKLWNEMPSHIKEATSLYNFKSLLSKWAGPECNWALVSYVRYTMYRYFSSCIFFYWLVGLYTRLYYFLYYYRSMF